MSNNLETNVTNTETNPSGEVNPEVTSQVGANTEINLEQLTSFLRDNTTVLQEILQEDFASPILRPLYDREVSKGIQTWRKNNEEKIRNEIKAELNPAETPEQKALKEVQEQLAKMTRETQVKEMEIFKRDLFHEVGLDSRFTSYIQGDTEEAIRHNAGEFKALVDELVTSGVSQGVEERFKSQSFEPKGESKVSSNSTSKDWRQMSHAEKTTLLQSDPSAYYKLKQEAVKQIK